MLTSRLSNHVSALVIVCLVTTSVQTGAQAGQAVPVPSPASGQEVEQATTPVPEPSPAAVPAPSPDSGQEVEQDNARGSVFFLQTRRVLAPGQLVRVRAEGGKWRLARYLRVMDGQLHVSPYLRRSETLLLPEASTRLQIQTGSVGHTGGGLLVGAAIGALVGVAEGRSDDDSLLEPDEGGLVLMGMVFFGVLGAVVGTLVRTPVWEDVSRSPSDSALLHREDARWEEEAGLFSR